MDLNEIRLAIYEAEASGHITSDQREYLLDHANEVYEMSVSKTLNSAKSKIANTAKNLKDSVGKKKRLEEERQAAIKKCEDRLEELRHSKAKVEKELVDLDKKFKNKSVDIETVERGHAVQNSLYRDIQNELKKLANLKSGAVLAAESVVNDITALAYKAEAMGVITSDECDYLMESVDYIEDTFDDYG